MQLLYDVSWVFDQHSASLTHLFLLLSFTSPFFRNTRLRDDDVTILHTAQATTSTRPATLKPVASTTSEASKEEKLQKFLATQKQWITPKPTVASLTRHQAEAAVVQDLLEICRQFRDPTKNTPPLLQISTKKRVDLFGSFLYDDDSKQNPFDFFDTNDRGEIVLSTPPPIFPDEWVVPNNNTDPNAFTPIPEYGPTWWGIIEPKLAVGKYLAPPKDPSAANIRVNDAVHSNMDPKSAPLNNGSTSVKAPTPRPSGSLGSSDRVEHLHSESRHRDRPMNARDAVERRGDIRDRPPQYKTGRPDEPSRHPNRR